ncbi:hypothetical protein V1525DRAFT_401545 [Lipomyces kononenkoae]|uniref:Uncharacterized protein n=1 Tax=Lipomyces kononenkoae TaxID=34357 RepID=A0ACC3T2X6_LIPKO
MMADPLPSYYSPHGLPEPSRGLAQKRPSHGQPAASAAGQNSRYSFPPPLPEPIQPSPQLPFQLQHNSQIPIHQQNSHYSSTSSGSSSAFPSLPPSYSFSSGATASSSQAYFSHRSTPPYIDSPIRQTVSQAHCHQHQPFSLPPVRLHRQSPSPTSQHVDPVTAPVQPYYVPAARQQRQQQPGYSPESVNLPQPQQQQRPAAPPPQQLRPAPAHVAAAAAAVTFHQHTHSSQVAAAQVAATIADVTAHKPVKEIKRRTKTGCLTCRKRRIKCDERHPICFNCAKSKRVCLGYDPVFKAQRGDKREDKESSKSESESLPNSQNEVKRIKIDSLLAEWS